MNNLAEKEKFAKRAPNFRQSEKAHLLNIIANKYSAILEDKKTDRVSTTQKDQAWKVIENEFNATSSSSTYRSWVCLKKCYENMKKELRKTLAEERKEMMLTGGGPPPKTNTDGTDELLISILNKKTLVGMHNKFDDDANESLIERNNKNEDVVFEYINSNETSDETLPVSVFLFNSLYRNVYFLIYVHDRFYRQNSLT